ncbi:lipopolysaccharide assembly protein LapB [Cyanobium sp. Morenito 9A2]|uniref:tetratricopeptide repeat protein n=1 Tax=Cyanobium sp. Morenito 9A2 TaxID=2823718 RepID=UPI0020CDF456|nr:tetratricopeptide repeat protein [Cyanobium sp. Morenito 9A2]MCP9848424.1 tetratricopeptide repeat protein [Cyanobium sp. Morenito 9A2]
MAPRTPPGSGTGSRLSLRLGLLIATLAGLCLAGGWWLGQRSAGAGGPLPNQIALQRQAQQLQRSVDQGRASEAEKERLLQLLLALEQKAEATKLLERLADQNPERWPLRLLLAELRRDQNDRTGAEREVRQILNLSPDRIEALQLRTLLQMEQGRSGEAQAQLQAAFLRANTAPPSANALPLGLLLADLLQRQKQAGPAEALYLKLAIDHPRDPRPLLALALLKQEAGDTKAAQTALAKARERSPDKDDPRLDQVATDWGLAPLRVLRVPSAVSPKPVAGSSAVPVP